MSSVLVSCQSLSKSYHARPLFSGLTIGVFESDRIGVIGPNGAGKSTLMRIMAGQEQPDDGSLAVRRGARIAYVPQAQTFVPTATCVEVVTSAARASGVPAEDVQLRSEILLGQMGFADITATAGSLSGGWKKRLSIACGLVQEPDLLLLDEPTNHLDLEGILWLEKLLGASRCAWVLVSHDRYFLERTVTKIAEVSRIYPDGVFLSEGRYNDFLVKREDYLNQQARLEEALANKVKREVEWLRRQPQARATKAKFRIDEAHAMIGELASLRSRIGGGNKTDIDFATSGRKTKRLVVADQVAKTLGERVIAKDLSLVLTPGMSLGLMGGNGTGKTTILKMLAGVLEPDKGTVIHADGLRVVYFDQNREGLDPAKTLKETLCEHGDAVVYRDKSIHIITWAKRFQFTADQLSVVVGDLSGGEQARALIAKLMLTPADVLLLDEPTNDLDIPTLEVLEESLSDFPGALVLVTHDRYLLNNVSNIVLGLDGRGGYGLFADYEQWEKAMLSGAAAQRAADRPKAAPGTLPKGQDVRATNQAKRLSYMEQREYDQMEAQILTAEEDLEAKRAVAEDPKIASSAARLKAAFDELGAAQSAVERLYARWAELEAKRS